jgi:hypothetical protein
MNKLKLANLPPCGGCEESFTTARPATDIGVFFNRDLSIGAALLCKACRDKWFNCGAFTLSIPEANRFVSEATK